VPLEPVQAELVVVVMERQGQGQQMWWLAADIDETAGRENGLNPPGVVAAGEAIAGPPCCILWNGFVLAVGGIGGTGGAGGKGAAALGTGVFVALLLAIAVRLASIRSCSCRSCSSISSSSRNFAARSSRAF